MYVWQWYFHYLNYDGTLINMIAICHAICAVIQTGPIRKRQVQYTFARIARLWNHSHHLSRRQENQSRALTPHFNQHRRRTCYGKFTDQKPREMQSSWISYHPAQTLSLLRPRLEVRPWLERSTKTALRTGLYAHFTTNLWCLVFCTSFANQRLGWQYT